MPPSILVQRIYLTFTVTLRPAEMRRRAHAGFYCPGRAHAGFYMVAADHASCRAMNLCVQELAGKAGTYQQASPLMIRLHWPTTIHYRLAFERSRLSCG